jgi:hypothetical protein
MPALNNAKQERACQHYVMQKVSQVEAYERAGYSNGQAHAAKFFGKPHVAARCKEMRQEVEVRVRQGMDNYGVDREWVLARLIDNAREAYKDRQFGPANQALSLVGKELGMFIERKEIRMMRTLDDLPATDRERLLQAIDDELERRQSRPVELDAPRQLEGVAD